MLETNHSYKTPGVYSEHVSPSIQSAFATGLPAFLGFIDIEPAKSAIAQADKFEHHGPKRITSWSEFDRHFRSTLTESGRKDGLPRTYLPYAVRGFYENEGHVCYVVPLAKPAEPGQDLQGLTQLQAGLKALEEVKEIDLICAPDIMIDRNKDAILDRQVEILRHCDRLGDRFAVLDSWPLREEMKGKNLPQDQQARVQSIKEQWTELYPGESGALYYPWLWVADLARPQGRLVLVPPCGHLSGMYSRVDRVAGVHKAPANEVLAGVLDLEVGVTEAEQELLNPAGININCLRSFPGRGIRVWGARTLSGQPAWKYVNVRRLISTCRRWAEAEMVDAAFEPNDPSLWERIRRGWYGYCSDLFRRGALKGRTPEEAFRVKCDLENNPADAREHGTVTVEISLAPAAPGEFVVVRFIHRGDGLIKAEVASA